MRKRKSEGWMSRMSADGVKQRTEAVSARVWLTDHGSAALHSTDTLTSLTSGTSPNNWQNKLLFNTAAPATFPCQAAHRCWKADGSAVSQPWGFFLLSAAPHYDECCRCKLHYTSMSASSHLEQPRLRYPWHFPCFQTPSSSSSARGLIWCRCTFSLSEAVQTGFFIYLFSFWLEHFLSLFLFILCSSDFRFICTGFSFFSPPFLGIHSCGMHQPEQRGKQRTLLAAQHPAKEIAGFDFSWSNKPLTCVTPPPSEEVKVMQLCKKSNVTKNHVRQWWHMPRRAEWETSFLLALHI